MDKELGLYAKELGYYKKYGLKALLLEAKQTVRSEIMQKLSALDYREFKSKWHYKELWGEDCPSDETPDLILFRGKDLQQLSSALTIDIDSCKHEKISLDRKGRYCVDCGKTIKYKSVRVKTNG